MSVEVLPPRMYPQGEFYEPNCWSQRRFQLSEAPDLLLSGRLGCGKTRGATEKCDDRCRTAINARVAITRLHRAHIGISILPELKKTVSPSHWDACFSPAADGGSTLYYPDTGSLIVLLGLDWPQRLQSSEFDLVIVEEATETNENIWEMVGGRMRNRAMMIDPETEEVTDRPAYQQVAGVCNPDTPDHYLFKKFRPDRGSHVIKSETEIRLFDVTFPVGTITGEVICAEGGANLANLGVEYLSRLARQKGRYYDRMVLGKWVAAEGMVYDCFDRDVHVISRPRSWIANWAGYPPAPWSRYRGVDFGYWPDPFVCRWFAESPAGDFYMYREIYMSSRTPMQHAAVINAEEDKELAALIGCARKAGHLDVPRYLNIEGSWGDHAATDRATLENEGVVVQPAHKDRSPGIQTYYELLTPQKRGTGGRLLPFIYYIEPDGEWGSLVERDARRLDEGKTTCGLEEIPSYRFDPDKPGGLLKTLGEDHAMDADRYLFESLKWSGGCRAMLMMKAS